jgi:hypothetical protein
MDSVETEELHSEGILCGGCLNWIDECECDE